MKLTRGVFVLLVASVSVLVIIVTIQLKDKVLVRWYVRQLNSSEVNIRLRAALSLALSLAELHIPDGSVVLLDILNESKDPQVIGDALGGLFILGPTSVCQYLKKRVELDGQAEEAAIRRWCDFFIKSPYTKNPPENPKTLRDLEKLIALLYDGMTENIRDPRAENPQQSTKPQGTVGVQPNSP